MVPPDNTPNNRAPAADITVCYDGEDFNLPPGAYLMEKLMALLGTPAGYILSYVDAADALTSFKANQKLHIKEGMKFFPCPVGGGSA